MHHGAARWLVALFVAATSAAGATPAASHEVGGATSLPVPEGVGGASGQLALAGGLFEHAPSPHALPDLAFVDVNGRARHLADFRGRVILLNLWATWCPPCRQELPTLDHLQALLGGPDFEVVALSIDRGGLAAVTSYFDEFDVRALHVYVDASARALAKVGGIALPTTILIGRDGRELARHVGPADWDRPDVVALLRRYIAADVARTTPASFIRWQAPASDPDVSIARHASSTTTTSNPRRLASTADHATQKSVASPASTTRSNPRSCRYPASPVDVVASASQNAE